MAVPHPHFFPVTWPEYIPELGCCLSVPCWVSFLTAAATAHPPSPHPFLLHRGCYTLNHLVIYH